MTCIHGLDENNCPTCRIAKSSIPKSQEKIKSLYNNDLTPNNSLFEQTRSNKQDISSDLSSHDTHFKLKSINIIPNARLLNSIPNFENKMFLERLNELSANKSDVFKISKKTSLLSPELKIKEED